MLDRRLSSSNDRLIHSRNVSFDDNDYIIPRGLPAAVHRDGSIHVDVKPAFSEEAEFVEFTDETNGFSESAVSETCKLYHPQPDRDEFFLSR